MWPVHAEEELTQLLDRLLAAPHIDATEGFTAKVLVPPGQLYDPLFMVPRTSTESRPTPAKSSGLERG